MANPDDGIIGTSIEITGGATSADILQSRLDASGGTTTDLDAALAEQNSHEQDASAGVSPPTTGGRKRSADVAYREQQRNAAVEARALAAQELARARAARADLAVFRRDRAIERSTAPAAAEVDDVAPQPRVTPSYEQAAGITFQQPDYSNYDTSSVFTPRPDAEYRAEEDARQSAYWKRVNSSLGGNRKGSDADERSPMQAWRDRVADATSDVQDIFASSGRGWDVHNRSDAYRSALEEAFSSRGIAIPRIALDEPGSYKQLATQAKSIESSLRDEYAESGRFGQIGGKSYKGDYQDRLIEAGIVTHVDAEDVKPRGLRGLLSNEQARFALGFGVMQLGGEASQAYASTHSGQYVTPEQQIQANSSMYAGAGAIIGTVAGAAIPVVGPMLGGFAGGAIGGGVQSAVGAYEERTEATRHAAEELAASLGSATSKIKDFTANIEATGAPVKDFGQNLAAALGVGNAGANTVNGLGRLTNALGEYSVADTQMTAGYIGANPMLWRFGSKLAGGNYGSGDASSLGFDAAEEGDYGSLRTFQRDAQRLKLENDPRYQLAVKKTTDVFKFDDDGSLGSKIRGIVLGPIGELAWRGGKYVAGSRDAADIIKNQGEDPNAAIQNALADQMNTIREQRLSSEALAQVGVGRLSDIVERGGSLSAVSSATESYRSTLRTAESDVDQRIALLKKDLGSPAGKGRETELQRKIDQATAERQGYTSADIAAANNVFDMGVAIREGGFGVSSAEAQNALTASILGGSTYRDAAGLEAAATGTMRKRANYELSLAADMGNRLKPQERSQYRASGIALRTTADVQDNAYLYGGINQRLGESEIDIANARLSSAKAAFTDTPDELYHSRAGILSAEDDNISLIQNALKQHLGRDQKDALNRRLNAAQLQRLSDRRSFALDQVEGNRDIYGNRESGDLAEAEISRMTGGSARAIGNYAAAKAETINTLNVDMEASTNKNLTPIDRARYARDAISDRQRLMQETLGQTQYTAAPGMQTDEIHLRGALGRASYSFLESGNINQMRGNLFSLIGREQRDYEAQIKKAFGDNIPEYAKPAIAQQEEHFRDERARVGAEMDRSFFDKLPSLTIGGTSFERRYLPTYSQAAAATEKVSGTLSAYNFGFFKGGSFNAAAGEVGPLMTAGHTPGDLSPGNMSLQAISTLIASLPQAIKDALNGASISMTGASSAGGPNARIQTSTSRTRGMGGGMPGSGG
jgi:hypothetical protein